MVGKHDADKRRRPVANQPEEVLQVKEEGLCGFDGDGDDDGGYEDGEEEAGDPEEDGEEHLKIQRYAVHCRREVAEHAELLRVRVSNGDG